MQCTVDSTDQALGSRGGCSVTLEGRGGRRRGIEGKEEDGGGRKEREAGGEMGRSQQLLLVNLPLPLPPSSKEQVSAPS